MLRQFVAAYIKVNDAFDDLFESLMRHHWDNEHLRGLALAARVEVR